MNSENIGNRWLRWWEDQAENRQRRIVQEEDKVRKKMKWQVENSRKKRKLVTGILWIVLCLGILLLTGCGTSGKTEADQKKADSGEEVQTEKNDKVQIGLTVDSFVIERWIRDRDAFVATARELGAEVNGAGCRG